VSFKDHFSARAGVYARARPSYPEQLFAELARRSPRQELAWDSGTGNGQAARGLAEHFERVIATDPSQAQLDEALPHPRITFRLGREAESGLPGRSADLVTAAQAAHWFDLPAFYVEVRRVLRPGGIIAMWSYGLCRIEPAIDAVVDPFYNEVVGPYWPPERKHVDAAYATLPFPFDTEEFPRLSIVRDWTLDEFIDYVRSWSAVNRYVAAKTVDPIPGLASALRPLWPGSRTVTWPIAMRLGRVA
jgi:SAM-dependent methyltransferase